MAARDSPVPARKKDSESTQSNSRGPERGSKAISLARIIHHKLTRAVSPGRADKSALPGPRVEDRARGPAADEHRLHSPSGVGSVSKQNLDFSIEGSHCDGQQTECLEHAASFDHSC
jgi:hypothetical protein